VLAAVQFERISRAISPYWSCAPGETDPRQDWGLGPSARCHPLPNSVASRSVSRSLRPVFWIATSFRSYGSGRNLSKDVPVSFCWESLLPGVGQWDSVVILEPVPASHRMHHRDLVLALRGQSHITRLIFHWRMASDPDVPQRRMRAPNFPCDWLATMIWDRLVCVAAGSRARSSERRHGGPSAGQGFSLIRILGGPIAPKVGFVFQEGICHRGLKSYY